MNQNRCEKRNKPDQEVNSGVGAAAKADKQADEPKKGVNSHWKAEHLKIQVKGRSRGLGDKHGKRGFLNENRRWPIRRPAFGRHRERRCLVLAQYTRRRPAMLRRRQIARGG